MNKDFEITWQIVPPLELEDMKRAIFDYKQMMMVIHNMEFIRKNVNSNGLIVLSKEQMYRKSVMYVTV